MAVDLEQTVMREIGLGQHYSWSNGSGSCQYIRRKAVLELQPIAQNHGLSISPAWLKHCQIANQVDQVNGRQYSLTNTWVSCSYAIQDAIYRNEGGEDAGFSPDNHRWQFWSDKERRIWEHRQVNKAILIHHWRPLRGSGERRSSLNRYVIPRLVGRAGKGDTGANE